MDADAESHYANAVTDKPWTSERGQVAIPSTAQCRPEPSNDLPRRGNDGNKKPQAPRTRKAPLQSQEPPTEKSVITPETPGHDDDPDRIDDVV